jgi:O-antigen/teichoic acid export membrane protein
MTWIIPKDQIGMIGVIAAWLPFLLLSSMSGIDSSAYHYLTKGHQHAFIQGVIFRLRWSITGTIIFLAGAIYWFLTEQAQLGWMFGIAAVTFPFTYAMTAVPGFFGARGWFNSLFWYRIGESITDFFGFIPILLSFIWLSEGITFFSTNQLASLVLQAGTTVYVIGKIRKETSMDLPDPSRKKMIEYGRHLTAINGISVLQSRMDAWLVAMSQPLTTTADYSIALIIQEQLRKLWGIFTTLRYPVLVKLDSSERKKRLIIEGVVVWSGLSLACLVIILLSYWLIPLLLPETYQSSLAYIPVLLFAVIAGVPGGLIEMLFKMNEDAKNQYAMRIVGAVFGVFFPAILLSTYGAMGAAFGRMIANILFSMAGIILFFISKDLEQIPGEKNI